MRLKSAKNITRANFNPGYNTNLFDTVGCTLSRFADDGQAEVFIISDGMHLTTDNSAYTADEVKEVLEQLRDQKNWQFNFIGAVTGQEEGEVVQNAEDMGFQNREISMFRHNQRGFQQGLQVITKSLLGSILDNEDSKEFIFPGGRRPLGGKKGKRKGRKNKGQRRARPNFGK